MRTISLALAACAVATTAIALTSDFPQEIHGFALADQRWAASDECELGTDYTSCQLEASTKAYLRDNPVWINPNP